MATGETTLVDLLRHLADRFHGMPDVSGDMRAAANRLAWHEDWMRRAAAQMNGALHEHIAEMALIGNKRAEAFASLIDEAWSNTGNKS
jgi:hypothetical protein